MAIEDFTAVQQQRVWNILNKAFKTQTPEDIEKINEIVYGSTEEMKVNVDLWLTDERAELIAERDEYQQGVTAKDSRIAEVDAEIVIRDAEKVRL